MPELTRDAAADVRRELHRIDIPELGEDIYAFVSPIPARVVLNHKAFSENGAVTPDERMCYVLILSLCGEDGELLFTEEDVTVLQDWPAAALVNTAAKISRTLGLDGGPEDAAKNSPETQPDSKPTD